MPTARTCGARSKVRSPAWITSSRAGRRPSSALRIAGVTQGDEVRSISNPSHEAPTLGYPSTSDGRVGHPEGPRELRAVPRLAVAMRQHCPEAPPFHDDASRQGFGGLPQQLGRCAAQDKKPARSAGPVGEHPQHAEEVRTTMHLVHDDQPAQIFQGLHGVRETGEIFVAFQVEGGDGAAPPLRHHPGQGGLPHRPCACPWMRNSSNVRSRSRRITDFEASDHGAERDAGS